MIQIRKAHFGTVDAAARSVPLVLATDTPVERSGYVEQLDMSPQGVDLSRGDLPLIESHNASAVNIGVVRDIRLDGNKLRGVAVFGNSTRATELLADVQNGIVSGVSIGYRLLDEGRPTQLRDGRSALRFRFQPYEVSVVAVPADTEAGFFRAQPDATPSHAPLTKKAVMTYDTPRNHAAEIMAIAKGLPNGGATLAMEAITRGLTVEEFQREALNLLASKPVPTADTGDASRHEPVEVGFKRLRTAEDFRAHYGARANHRDRGLTMVDFLRGAARMKTSETATRALSVGVDSGGGYAVPNILMPGILEALTPASALLQAGATILPLEGPGKTFTIAGVDTLPTAAWRAENAAIAESEPTFREISLTPKSLSFIVKISRELLADGVGIDAAINQVIAQAMAKEIDRAGLRGSGTSPEPRGLRNIAGVHAVTNGANGASLASFANLFSAAEAILAADGGMPNAAIMSPRSLVKIGSFADTTGQPMRVPPMLERVNFVSTSQIPNNLVVGSSSDTSELYVGDFAHFMFGMRETLSIQILNELFAENGQIAFVVHARLDVAVTNAKRFALVTGIRP